MPQWVYVVGNNTGRFILREVVDNGAFLAPTLWSWRLYGPRPVRLPGGVLTGSMLMAWVKLLMANGYVFKDVTASTANP